MSTAPTTTTTSASERIASWYPPARATASFHRTHVTVEREFDERLPIAEGHLPDDLRGTLYRNGPARFERGGHAYRHLFDGDGMVASFRFSDGAIHYRNRFVQTREHQAEERAGRPLYRSFGTNRPGGMRGNALRLRFKNTANTNVCVHGGRLLALWEGGLPHELDPQTLETRGRCDFGGRLLAGPSLESAMVGRELPFSAHPATDPETGEMWNFGMRMGLRPHLLLYRVDAAGSMRPVRQVKLDELVFVHDFALTPRWMVFLLSPAAFDVAAMTLGSKSPVDALVRSQHPGSARRMEALLVERASLDEPELTMFRIPLDGSPSGFVFHVPNAFEDGDRVLVDAVMWPTFPHFPTPSADASRRGMPDVARADPSGSAPGPRVVRLTIEPRRHRAMFGMTSRASIELSSIAPERQGREHRYIWGLGNEPGTEVGFSKLVRLDRQTGDERTHAPAGESPSDLVLLSRVSRLASAGADDEASRYLAFTTYDSDAGRSDLHVVRADDFSPVARAHLPHVLPPGFHGVFVEDAPASGSVGATLDRVDRGHASVEVPP